MRPYPNVPIWIRPTDWEIIAPSMRESFNTWYEIEEKELLMLYECGHSLIKISEMMERSYASVQHKYKRLGGPDAR